MMSKHSIEKVVDLLEKIDRRVTSLVEVQLADAKQKIAALQAELVVERQWSQRMHERAQALAIVERDAERLREQVKSLTEKAEGAEDRLAAQDEALRKIASIIDEPSTPTTLIGIVEAVRRMATPTKLMQTVRRLRQMGRECGAKDVNNWSLGEALCWLERNLVHQRELLRTILAHQAGTWIGKHDPDLDASIRAAVNTPDPPMRTCRIIKRVEASTEVWIDDASPVMRESELHQRVNVCINGIATSVLEIRYKASAEGKAACISLATPISGEVGDTVEIVPTFEAD